MHMDACLRLFARYGVDAPHLSKAAQILAIGTMTTPRKIAEYALWHGRVAEAEVLPPVFIIGHWRSGTTHLHNLLSQDPQFAPVTYIHCAAAGIFLSQEKYARRRIGEKLPRVRPMDEMSLSLDSPAEEELALARISDTSFYHCFFFPRHLREIFRQSVLLEGLPPDRMQRWERKYTWFLKKVSLASAGRPLLLKNPANTGRVRQLLRLFPDARFIHIYRNPYTVYPSTRNLYARLLTLWSLHRYDLAEVDAAILDFYREMMPRYFDDAKAVPPGQLSEVRFEDLDTNPLPTLERIYSELHLPGFADARPRVEAYLATQTNYRKNTFAPDPETTRHVTKAWGFAAERWDYRP